MTFPHNRLQIDFGAFSLSFSTREALRLVRKTRPVDLSVAAASDWQQQSRNCDAIVDYDWTYQTEYSGTTTTNEIKDSVIFLESS